MKPVFTAALILCSFMLACTKQESITGAKPAAAPASLPGQYGMYGNRNARLSGVNYSQSIPLDTANAMLGSYLSSVGYPSVDTAIRSLSFDADTLRAYLQNSNIVTLKFMFAHQTSYINGGAGGQNTGMNPEAMTMIIVGVNNNEQYILNNRGGVYEHFSPCPAHCVNAVADAYIY